VQLDECKGVSEVTALKHVETMCHCRLLVDLLLFAFLTTVFKLHVEAIMSYIIMIRLFSNPFLCIFSTSTESDYICQMQCQNFVLLSDV
jgi:hypothetical protein